MIAIVGRILLVLIGITLPFLLFYALIETWPHLMARLRRKFPDSPYPLFGFLLLFGGALGVFLAFG